MDALEKASLLLCGVPSMEFYEYGDAYALCICPDPQGFKEKTYEELPKEYLGGCHNLLLTGYMNHFLASVWTVDGEWKPKIEYYRHESTDAAAAHITVPKDEADKVYQGLIVMSFLMLMESQSEEAHQTPLNFGYYMDLVEGFKNFNEEYVFVYDPTVEETAVVPRVVVNALNIVRPDEQHLVELS